MLIGLTGGIGSGKSTVSQYLKERGITVVDADLISRKIVEPGSEALAEIKEAFGSEYIQPDGTLARKKLGQRVFADKKELAKLNSIMSRKMGEEIERQIRASKTEITVLDAATLIEAGYDRRVDVLWIVDTDDETRIKRVMERDGASREDVINRMNNQMSREERLNRKCVVIDSSGSIEETREKVKAELEKIKK